MSKLIKSGLLVLLTILSLGGGYWMWHLKNYPTPRFMEPDIDSFGRPIVSGLSKWKRGVDNWVRVKKDNKRFKDELRIHRQNCLQTLAQFSFLDKFAGCDNVLEGRWYLHFESNGQIRIAFGNESGRAPRYAFDDKDFSPVDLEDVFGTQRQFKRIDATTLEISNPNGTHRFRLSPNFDAGNPLYACHGIRFDEMKGNKRRFWLWFEWPGDEGRYQRKFGYCKDIR